MRKCHVCGRSWEGEKQPAVKEACGQCGAYLHCCLNCKFFDEHAHNKCYIPNTDWVADRAGCNFCDEFTFADAERDAKGGARKAQARNALSQLFGGDEDAAPKPEGRDAFDKLFGD